MKRFWESLVRPILDQFDPKVMIEIGSYRGAHTELLLPYCRDHGIVLHAVDPLPQFDVAAWQAEFGDVFQFHHAKSLDVLRSLPAADLVLIDGDHNWYTVYNELWQLAEAAQANRKPYPVVLFHDIGWPYARRDLYYDPNDIPVEFRQPYARKGIRPGQSELQNDGLNEKLDNAITEGGPRNGVLTAVEDFMAEADEPMRLILIDGFHGLGILYPESLAEREPTLTDHLRRLADGMEVLGKHLGAVDRQMINGRLRTLRLRRRLAKLEGSREPADDEAE